MTLTRTALPSVLAVEERDESARLALIRRAHDRLLRDLDPRLLEQIDSHEARARAERAATGVIAELAPGTAEVRRQELVHSVVDETIGFGPMQRLLDDPDVS